MNRRTVDREAAERGRRVHGAQRQGERKPFFLYYPITQIHFPTLAHPDFAGKTGAGDIGDAMADVDHNTGLVLDAIKRLGIDAEHDRLLVYRQWRGDAPTVAGIVRPVERLLQYGDGRRHPHALSSFAGRVEFRPGEVSNEIVHQIDFFPTLAAAVGADIVPKDRAIDGVNQLPFLEGKQAKSNRDSVIFFTERPDSARSSGRTGSSTTRFIRSRARRLSRRLMRLFNLRSDPGEETDIKDANPWAQSVMDKIVADFMATTVQYPNVPANAPDPYVPPARRP